MRSIITFRLFFYLLAGRSISGLSKSAPASPSFYISQDVGPRAYLSGPRPSQCMFWSVRAIAGNQASISVDTVRQLMVLMIFVRWACCGCEVCALEVCLHLKMCAERRLHNHRVDPETCNFLVICQCIEKHLNVGGRTAPRDPGASGGEQMQYAYIIPGSQ